MPRPPRPDARPRLIAAALELFGRSGIERVDSNAVARQAGVGVGTFYRHFADKWALVDEIRTRMWTALRSVRRRGAGRGRPDDPTDQLRESIRAVVGLARRHPQAFRVTLGGERVAARRDRPVVRESIRPVVASLRRLQARGRLDPELDAELAVRAYAEAEAGLILWWLEEPRRAREEDLVETLVRLHPLSAGRPLAPVPVPGRGSEGRTRE